MYTHKYASFGQFSYNAIAYGSADSRCIFCFLSSFISKDTEDSAKERKKKKQKNIRKNVQVSNCFVGEDEAFVQHPSTAVYCLRFHNMFPCLQLQQKKRKKKKRKLKQNERKMQVNETV